MKLEKRPKYALWLALVVLLVAAIVFFTSCRDDASGPLIETDTSTNTETVTSLSADASAIAEARGLTPDDVAAALKTYMPTGRHDEYIMFASGGHAGQVFVVGF